MASWPVLSECAEADMRDEGVYALEFDGETHAICRANSVLIPNYIGKVLRVRHILMSPFYDFGDVSIEKYARALSKLFVGAIHLSNIGLPSPHVKFHLRSVADRQFFSTIGDSMSELDMFSSVKLKGSWLYITKA